MSHTSNREHPSPEGAKAYSLGRQPQVTENPLTKTMRRRIEQYRDRWSSYGGQTGILAVSEKLSPEELREHEIFSEYDDRFLEKISPDVSVALWREGSVLFEQGTYLDLAFFVTDGEVEVFLEGVGETAPAQPIFDTERTIVTRLPEPAALPGRCGVLLRSR